MAYIIISGSSIEDLTNKVNESLKEGNILQGGVSALVASFPNKICYQAMVTPRVPCQNCGEDMDIIGTCYHCMYDNINHNFQHRPY